MLQKTLIYIQKKLGFFDLISPEWHEVLSLFQIHLTISFHKNLERTPF